MKTKMLAGRAVHPIGIGTWHMGGAMYDDRTPYSDYSRDDQEITAIIHALDRGQNHIDTAMMYGVGHAEELVAQAIVGRRREDLFIASKLWKTHLRRDAVPRAVEGSLKRLGIDRLDMYYIHFPWEYEPMSSYIAGMNDAANAGLVGCLAVSNFTYDQLKEAVALSSRPIVANQVHYSVLERGNVSPQMMEYCRKNDIAVVAWRPVERGMHALGSGGTVIGAIAQRHHATPSQIAMAWLFAQEGVVAIPKASHTAHIDENIGALEIELSGDEMKRLDSFAG